LILGQAGVKRSLVDRYDHRIHFCGRKHDGKIYRIKSIMEIAQIPIFEFEYLKSDSRILGSDATE
jgi:hypothetical protein